MGILGKSSIAAIVFALALVLRLAVLYQVTRDPTVNHLTGDGLAYVKWADSIDHQSWIGREVFYQTPLYPYFLAALHTNDLASLRIIQAFFGALGCGLLCLGTARLLDPKTGLIAGLMLAIYPTAISFDLQIDKAFLDPILAAALVWCFAELIHQPKRWRFFVCGIILGLAALNRENALLLLVVMIVFAVWEKHRSGVVMLLLGSICILLPVSLRNSLISGEFHMVTSQFGPNFYLGNSHHADGLYQPLRPGRGDAEFERTDATDLAQQEAGHPLSPAGVSSFWTRKTIHEIADDPSHWLKLMAAKQAMVFANTELADSDVHDRFIVWSPILNTLDSFWTFGVLLTLAAIGIVMIWDRCDQIWPILVMAIVFAASVAMFFIFARYRMTLVALLIPFAAASIAHFQIRKWPIAIPIALAAIGVVCLGEWAIPQRIAGTNEYNRAIAFTAKNEPDRAISLYEKAIAKNPHLSAAHNNLGLLLARRGEFDRAIAEFQAALKVDPNNSAAKENLDLARRASTQPANP